MRWRVYWDIIPCCNTFQNTNSFLIFISLNASSLRIVANEYSHSSISGQEQVLAVAYYVMHPLFDNITKENDIALLKVENGLIYSIYIFFILFSNYYAV